MILCETEPEYIVLCSEYNADRTTDESGFDPLNNMRFYVISKVYRSAPETIQHQIQYMSRIFLWVYSRRCVKPIMHLLLIGLTIRGAMRLTYFINIAK